MIHSTHIRISPTEEPCRQMIVPMKPYMNTLYTVRLLPLLQTLGGSPPATAAGVLAIHLDVEPSLSPAQLKTWLGSVATPDVLTNIPQGNNLLLYSSIII